MTRVVAISIDQFYRPQPGGVATYARGLVRGLASLEDPEWRTIAVAPRGAVPAEVAALDLARTTAPLGRRALTRLWSRWALGVPANVDVVHAPSLAGPFAGGRRGAVHSVALHDVLWRDEPSAATARGVRFHESRLALLRRRTDLRVLVTSPGLGARLVAEGFDVARLHEVRFGVDDTSAVADPDEVRRLLVEHGVTGPFTLYAGTREPRKNLERLIAAHTIARHRDEELGPLVLVGPTGWGSDTASGATVVGPVARPVLRGLYRAASIVAYVPRAEGFGLPPVEALFEGTRVLASTVTPSVAANAEVDLVDPLEVEAIAAGLTRALSRADDVEARARRRSSVADLTWRQSALDHLAAWT